MKAYEAPSLFYGTTTINNKSFGSLLCEATAPAAGLSLFSSRVGNGGYVMSAQTLDFGQIFSSLAAALPPIERLSNRTREALGNFGASVAFEIYEAARCQAGTGNPIMGKDSSANANLQSDRWTIDDTKYLRDNFQKQTSRQLAAKLGRTAHAVQQMAGKLGLSKVDRQRSWSPSETQYLRDNYGKEKVAVIARQLGRSVGSVSNKAMKLGLFSYDPDYPQKGHQWDEAEVDYVRAHSQDDIADISAKIGRSISAVRNKCLQEGIRLAHEDACRSDRDARIMILKKKGLSRAQISERLNVSPSIVSSVTRKQSNAHGADRH